MNLILQHGNVHCPVAIVRLVESRLLRLGERQRIEEAIVRLTDAPEASPRFHASILIRVAGPDIHATACDHTVRVAIEKALAAVEAQVDLRQVRRKQRQRSQLQLSSVARTGHAW